MTREDLIQNLRDAGCGDEDCAHIADLLTQGQEEAAMKLLSKRRQKLLDAIHTEQKKIDCLDYLRYCVKNRA